MTKEVYDKIKKQIRKLDMEKPKVIQAISDARDLGDLSENAEYHGARERLAQIEGRIAQLSAQLSNTEIVNEDDISTDAVGFGTSVRLYEKNMEEEMIVTIVSTGDADPDKDEISVTSPLAQGILDKKVGDIAKVNLPMGEACFEIKEIFIK